ncbi:hypothetical protein I3271_07545 [Photobacterium leiognathi]|uniref:hypothetical protein n=1 Tax=Photobacterium leiognathi TaxID=553611 RepID=UPI001EDF1525|nr:hypothetical protein [Photobacterium leiognathi]MCG3884540.1 hypothetical protein [Photobacterium leiognathi]
MLDAGEYGFTQMALLLAHEYCHDDTDVGTHVHSNEFYEKFHNITVAPNKKLDVIGHIASSMKQRYISEISSKLLESSKAAPYDTFEINEHVITLKSKGQVSNLLRSILDYFKEKNAINYTEKSNKINIISSTKRTFYINVLHALIKLAEKDGVKIKPFNAEDYPNLVISRNSGGATHNDYEKARQDHYEKMLEKMKPWAHKYEHCLEARSEILLQRESYRLGNIETLAEIALKDRNSGVISYKSPISTSPNINYRTTTINYGSSIIGAMIGERWNHDFTLRELIESKKKRSEFTIKAITSVIKSLKNQDERREALQILSNESFKQNVLN